MPSLCGGCHLAGCSSVLQCKERHRGICLQALVRDIQDGKGQRVRPTQREKVDMDARQDFWSAGELIAGDQQVTHLFFSSYVYYRTRRTSCIEYSYFSGNFIFVKRPRPSLGLRLETRCALRRATRTWSWRFALPQAYPVGYS